MDTALSQQELEEMLDIAVREVTEITTGVSLHKGGGPPGGDFCTVHVTFKKGVRSSLSLQADRGMMTEMAQRAFHNKLIKSADLEDFAKEYFNVLCGRVAGQLYRLTRTSVRFGVPEFRWGYFEPENHSRQFTLNYSDDQSRSVQLIHLIPRLGRNDGGAETTSV